MSEVKQFVNNKPELVKRIINTINIHCKLLTIDCFDLSLQYGN